MVEIELRGRDGAVRAVTLVDDEDAALADSRWSLQSRGYAKRGREGRLLHREIMGLEPGDRREVDHIDGDPLNNRRSNLRICTHAQNGQNQRARGGRSAHRGVVWNGDRAKWQAQVTLGGRYYYLGLFDDELAAARAAAAYRARNMPYSAEAA